MLDHPIETLLNRRGVGCSRLTDERMKIDILNKHSRSERPIGTFLNRRIIGCPRPIMRVVRDRYNEIAF